MSLIPYDLNKIRSLGIPETSLNDWLKIVTATSLADSYWAMRSFIRSRFGYEDSHPKADLDTYGTEAFWAYKDQNMMTRYSRTLSDAEKAIYIQKMMEHESRFTDE